MITIHHEPSPDEGDERRSHVRISSCRPVKIYDERSGKYYIGSTCDISAGGVLIELPHAIAAHPDDALLVAIAEKRRQPLLRQSQMIRATIVRIMRADSGRMLMALAFRPEATLPLTTSRLAA
jgi:c-di-GMP-binding flagellar brake protein YcgR